MTNQGLNDGLLSRWKIEDVEVGADWRWWVRVATGVDLPSRNVFGAEWRTEDVGSPRACRAGRGGPRGQGGGGGTEHRRVCVRGRFCVVDVRGKRPFTEKQQTALRVKAQLKTVAGIAQTAERRETDEEPPPPPGVPLGACSELFLVPHLTIVRAKRIIPAQVKQGVTAGTGHSAPSCIPTTCGYPRKRVPTETCPWVLTAAPVITVRRLERLTCLPAGEWVNEPSCIRTVEDHPVLKQQSRGTTWMSFEHTGLGEGSRSRKTRRGRVPLA